MKLGGIFSPPNLKRIIQYKITKFYLIKRFFMNHNLKKKLKMALQAVVENHESFNSYENLKPGFFNSKVLDFNSAPISINLKDLVSTSLFFDCEDPRTYLKKPNSTQFSYLNSRQMIDFFNKLVTPSYVSGLDTFIFDRLFWGNSKNNGTNIISRKFRRKKRLEYLNRALQAVYGQNCIDYGQVPFDSIAYGWQQFLVSYPDYFNIVLLKIIWYEYCCLLQLTNSTAKKIGYKLNDPICEQLILKEILFLTRPFGYLENLPQNYFQQKRIKISDHSLHYLQRLKGFQFQTSNTNINYSIDQSYNQFWNSTICNSIIKNFLLPSAQKYKLTTSIIFDVAVILTRFYSLIDFWNSTVIDSKQ